MKGMWLKLGHHPVVAAAIRQAFIQPGHASATQTWRHVADQLWPRFEKLARPHGSLGSVPNPWPMSEFNLLFAPARFEGGTRETGVTARGNALIRVGPRGRQGVT